MSLMITYASFGKLNIYSNSSFVSFSMYLLSTCVYLFFDDIENFYTHYTIICVTLQNFFAQCCGIVVELDF